MSLYTPKMCANGCGCFVLRACLFCSLFCNIVDKWDNVSIGDDRGPDISNCIFVPSSYSRALDGRLLSGLCLFSTFSLYLPLSPSLSFPLSLSDRDEEFLLNLMCIHLHIIHLAVIARASSSVLANKTHRPDVFCVWSVVLEVTWLLAGLWPEDGCRAVF